MNKSFFLKAASLFIGVFLCLNLQKGQAQKFFSPFEIGFQGGASTYFGDLNTNYGLHYIRPSGGIFLRYSFNPYIALKGMANYTKVGYEDRFSKDPFQQIRNLKFRSDIIEVAVVSEFNFFYFKTGDTHHRFTPFLSGGIGLFYHNPYTFYQDTRYNLRALGTEGQNTQQYKGRKYSTISVCFPVGAGIKYWLGPGSNLSLQLLNRFTLTDYIDDVSTTYIGVGHFQSDANHPTPAAHLQDPSKPINGQKLGSPGKQRGDANTFDQYIMFQISFSFQLKTYKCPANKFQNW